MTQATKPCCQIGAWPDHEAIDADIRATRMGIRSIAAKYKITKGMVERHRTHLGVVGGPPNGSAWQKEQEEQEPPELLPGEEGAQDVEVEPGESRDTVVQTPEKDNQVTVLPDGVEIVRVKRDGDGSNARARGFPNPKALATRLERVEYVADLVATGQWHGRRTARRLATLWGYSSLDEPWAIRREAQMVLDAHRGPLQETRAETVERLRRYAREAKRGGDIRAATVAEVKAAEIDGIVPSNKPGGGADPEAFAAVWRELAAIIREYPECMARCEAVLAKMPGES